MSSKQAEFRRYLVPINSVSNPQFFTDCLVIGAGIAGLRAALEAARTCGVTLVCKDALQDSNTWNAQGGIAAVIRDDDSLDSHIQDTLKTGCGLSDKKIVEKVVREAPDLIRELVNWGTAFDRVDGQIDATREGGHSHARVIHAMGDSTGRGIAEALIEKVRQHPNIRVIEYFYTIDLLTNGKDENECVGAVGRHRNGSLQIIWAYQTILATGGAGRLYRETTNPESSTGDGLAIAWRAGPCCGISNSCSFTRRRFISPVHRVR